MLLRGKTEQADAEEWALREIKGAVVLLLDLLSDR